MTMFRKQQVNNDKGRANKQRTGVGFAHLWNQRLIVLSADKSDMECLKYA
jgi:hypothetical protein